MASGRSNFRGLRILLCERDRDTEVKSARGHLQALFFKNAIKAIRCPFVRQCLKRVKMDLPWHGVSVRLFQKKRPSCAKFGITYDRRLHISGNGQNT